MPSRRTTPGRTPNQPLRRLLSETGWSGARLARELNAAATEQGWPLTYDRTTVSHWLAGTRPRPHIAQLAAEVLSRALGRPVSVTDTGLNPAPAESGASGPVPWGDAAVDMLEHLNEPPGQGGHSLGAVYSLAGLALPTWAPRAERSVSTRTGDPVVGPEQVAACQSLLPVFSRADACFGAGVMREALSRFLAISAAGWLRLPAEPRFRRGLCTVAGQMAYLCAFAHFDSNLHRRAQQYYLTSLALAHEAGDRAGYALGLRGLSVQAHALGHFPQADRLAAQAVSLGLPHTPSGQQAFFLGQLAVTRASLNDPKAAARHLTAAEHLLDGAASSTSPVGAYHPAALALHHAVVAGSLGDHRRAATSLQASLRHRPPTENRSRAITLAQLAEAQLNCGSLELACHTWAEFLTVHSQISSARVDGHLATLIARIRPYRHNRAAAALLDRAQQLRPRRATGKDAEDRP
ncbi:hypothetical protein ACIBL5_06895 [Streptomyces sp. NPDC050516]|uniref:hypothetical protein n=1 Tax=Streptomyces sp. NPDC050516 TaxID=3365621 RepID=UPI0037ADE0FA